MIWHIPRCAGRSRSCEFITFESARERSAICPRVYLFRVSRKTRGHREKCRVGADRSRGYFAVGSDVNTTFVRPTIESKVWGFLKIFNGTSRVYMYSTNVRKLVYFNEWMGFLAISRFICTTVARGFGLGFQVMGILFNSIDSIASQRNKICWNDITS